MKLTNTSKRDRGIPGNPFTVLAVGESMNVTADQLLRLKQNVNVAGWFHHGYLAVTDGDEPAPEEAPKEYDSVRLVQHGSWYHVEAGGITVTDKKVRKAEAEKIAAEYE